MIQKGQWTILPFSVVEHFVDLQVSPPGVVPQHDRRPRWIVDYSFYDVNDETLPLVAEGSMQFGHALERILRHILLSDPNHGPVYLLKIDISDGFYRIDVNPFDIPRLGVVFPTEPGRHRASNCFSACASYGMEKFASRVHHSNRNRCRSGK